MSEYIETIRALVGHERLLIAGTACVVLDESRRVLLHKRRDKQEWGIPGGVMDLGETVLESMKREVEEETGLRVVDPELFGVYSGSRYDSTYPNGDQTATVLTVFIASRVEGELQKSEESTSLGYHAIDDLPRPLEPISADILEHLNEHLDGTRELPVIL